MPIITITTDFGTRDHFVAAMKGIIYQIHPKATIVDVSHDIGPQDIFGASMILHEVLRCFPAGTVHLVVVDPTVGSDRAIIAAKYDNQYVVCPDNGLLTLPHKYHQQQQLNVVTNQNLFCQPVSRTFHGRDIMAPVAAHLSKGMDMDRLGQRALRMTMLDYPSPRYASHSITGQVVYIDHFGNLATNITREDFVNQKLTAHHCHVQLETTTIGTVAQTYSQTEPGLPLALFNSSEMLEIAVCNGNAAATFGAMVGTPVTVTATDNQNLNRPEVNNG